MKKNILGFYLLSTLLCLTGLTGSAMAQDSTNNPTNNSAPSFPYTLEEVSQPRIGGNIQVISVDGDSFAKASLSPNFNYKNFELGLDASVYLPIGDNNHYPEEFNFLTFRHIAYNGESFGIKWGRLRGVTFGRGLLMGNYDSGFWGSNQFSNEKAGALGYVNYRNAKVKAMYTASQVKAARAAYAFEDTFLLGSDIEVGVNYVTDSDGIDRRIKDDVTIMREEKSGMSIDIAAPIAGDYLVAYVEHAQLSAMGKTQIDSDATKGTSLGLQGQLSRLSYVAEYRILKRHFVPNYFNSTYESSSFLFNENTLQEDTNGYLAGVSLSLLDNLLATAQIEGFQNRNPLYSTGLAIRNILGASIAANYVSEFQSNNQGTLSVDAMFARGAGLNYVVNYKRVYLGPGEFDDSYSVGLNSQF